MAVIIKLSLYIHMFVTTLVVDVFENNGYTSGRYVRKQCLLYSYTVIL